MMSLTNSCLPRPAALAFLPGFAALALGLAAQFAGPGAARAENLHVNYRVSLIGLPIGAAVADGAVNSERYKVGLNVKLTGLAALVTNLKMALASAGSVGHNTIAPSAYATTAANSHETRTLRMALDAGTVEQVQYSPQWDPNSPDRVPVTAAHKRDILDPLSAFIMPVPAGSNPVGPGACDRRVPVYDGYTRFDVTLSYVGVRDVKTNGYAGPVTICAARYIPISGHRPDAKSTKFMAENEDMQVWLAPIPNVHMVMPYRVSLMTMAGTAVIEASELRFTP